MSTSKSPKNFFAAFRPTIVNKRTVVEASELIFHNFLELHNLEKRYDAKLATLEENPSLPTYISDVGKNLMRAMQLPTKDQRTTESFKESAVRIESILVKAQEEIRNEELVAYRKASISIKTTLRSYMSEPQLLALLVQTAAPAPETETQTEAKNLWTTINAFLEQEKEKLSAMETEKVEPDTASNTAILAALSELQKSIASLQKTQQQQQYLNEKSRSNLPQQSTKTKNPPPRHQKQQQPRGRSQSARREHSESRGRSDSATSNRRVKDSEKKERSRSTSRAKPKHNSSR